MDGRRFLGRGISVDFNGSADSGLLLFFAQAGEMTFRVPIPIQQRNRDSRWGRLPLFMSLEGPPF